MSSSDVDTTNPRSGFCLPWAASALFGTAMGGTAWALTAWARAYCDAGDDAGGRLELTFLFPLVLGAGAALGLAARATARILTRRAPAALRAVLPTLLVIAATVWPAWWLFATRGTLAGYPGDSGLCPATNIPPQWPAWLPA
ncbi:hypothetical protein AB0O68_14400 [Streptomyces sp. NPDC087512]|uniref:hypothetical protein n=1 Tax=Streptomyces sp. NPDC087512 TaxID=3155059 RepID=UPI00343D786B